MLGVSLRDKITSHEIRKRTGVEDVMERVVRKRSYSQIGAKTIQIEGPPKTLDDIRENAGKNWLQLTQDRIKWKQKEEAYVQEWTTKC
ncbi:hypothetical protein Trydic_g16374 [Trypoxylus dichotomus]